MNKMGATYTDYFSIISYSKHLVCKILDTGDLTISQILEKAKQQHYLLSYFHQRLLDINVSQSTTKC